MLQSPGSNHPKIALGLLEQAGTAGNLTTDAQSAAYALENDGEMHSNDTEFGRFPGVTWVNPLNYWTLEFGEDRQDPAIRGHGELAGSSP